jgi:uncharacterized protein (TIGR03437 family)
MRVRSGLTFVFALTAAAAVCRAQGTITTVAGSRTCCNSNDGIQATAAWLGSVLGIAIDPGGNLYVHVNQRIRKVAPNGVLSTVAGNGTSGGTGDGGPATSAQIFPNGEAGLAVDAAGNLYISDGNNHRIRKVNTAGIISTVAGTGAPGYSGDGGPATSAMLNYPEGIALDAAGNLYIADRSNSRVRRVTPAGVISTIAGNGNSAYSGDGVLPTSTAVDQPQGVTVDAAGNLYISETSSSRVRKVNAQGIISTVAGLTQKTTGFTGDGGPATSATLFGPIGLATDAAGNLYIADNGNGRIRKVDAAGIITTVAGNGANATNAPTGDGGLSTNAALGTPRSLAFDTAGNMYIGGGGGGWSRVRKVSPSNAALTTNPASLTFNYTTGGAAPASQSVSIASAGAATGFTAAASTSSGGNWLAVSPSSGTTPANVNVSVTPTGLAGGVYQGAIRLTPAGGAAQTFAVTLNVTGAGAPAFSATSVVNASGYQNKLAPGAVFVIFGDRMGPSTLVSGAAPYETSLGGTSITFTPASGGNGVSARLVYSSAGQVAGLLPSSIAPGTYAVRVSYNSVASAPQNVTVAARSFGIATANSAGSGTAQATIGNVNGGVSLLRLTSGRVSFGGLDWTLTPAHPGDTLVLWGTGGGADQANDTGGSSGDQTQAGSFVVTVSGRQITPLYAGASAGYPGLWQINFTLPGDIAAECFAPVQVVAGSEVSNTVTIPIAAAGQSACSDSQLSRDALAALDGGGTIALGGFTISKVNYTANIVMPGGNVQTFSSAQDAVSGGIAVYSAAAYASLSAGQRFGACTVTDRTASNTEKSPGAPDGYLDAGAPIAVTGPGVPAGAGMTVASANPGPVYNLSLTGSPLAGGGRYTVNAPGGKGLSAFTASVNFPAQFNVTNWDAITSIDRSRALTVNWTGGSDQVYIIASTSKVLGKDAAGANISRLVTVTCQVPAGPGTFSVPAAALANLLPIGIDSASQSTGTSVLAVQTVVTQPFNAPLTGGGSAAYAALIAIQSVSKNIAVQ